MSVFICHASTHAAVGGGSSYLFLREEGRKEGRKELSALLSAYPPPKKQRAGHKSIKMNNPIAFFFFIITFTFQLNS